MKKAFTLIELLVVIAIIAILAAILFPVFAQAKLAAKKTAELSQAKQIGTAAQIYLNDFDDTYMPTNYRNNTTATFTGSNFGETHWSIMLMPYLKNADLFVSPADPNGGWAPTCYDTTKNNSGKGAPAGQTSRCDLAGYNTGIYTTQVPRISWTSNQMIMPRKRTPADTSNVVSATVVDGISQTILLTPFSDKYGCMTKGGETRSYRATFAVRDSASFTNSFSNALPATSQLWAMNKAEVTRVFNCNVTNADLPNADDHVLRYANPGRFGSQGQAGNNYIMTDTSAKYTVFDKTIDTNRFMWGKAGYSLGGASVVERVSGQPVN